MEVLLEMQPGVSFEQSEEYVGRAEASIREIGLGHLLRLEGALEALVRLRVAGEQEAAAGVAVEPVDGERRALEAEAEMAEIIVEALGRLRAGVDGEAGRLVDDDRLAIDEEDVILPHPSRPATAVAAAQRSAGLIGNPHLIRN